MNRTDLPIVSGHRRKTASLLAGCSLATVLALSAQQAAAQSFNGTPSVVAGAADITTGVGTTNVTIKAPETVINWTSVTATNAIDFQPLGTTATFVDGVAGAPIDYTVLNRILPVDAGGAPMAATVAFNGTINSLVGGKQGGNVWFYSPTGIIVGPTAAFNVGSLILTTDDINYGAAITGGTELYGPNNTVQFRGPAGSTGLVDVQAGSTINASNYVALVAPRVQQGGTVSANGPIGYIGAEQLDMTINAGLFDISILAGTTDANGVVHTGTTTGSASTGYFDRKQITMVALPKSTALTMLLSGSIGYTPAASAYDDGSSVVLSAGDLGSPDGNISIGDTAFANRLNATASGSIAVAPTPGDSGTGAAGGTTSFANYTSLSGVKSVTLTADHGSTISTALGINLSSSDPATGGNVTVEALGGSGLSPAGQMTFTNGLYASAGSTDFGTGSEIVGGDGLGGSVTLSANGGDIVADYISLDAGANGAQGTQQGGDGRAGSVSVSAGYGGSITSGSTSLYATGRGGGAYDPEGAIGYGGDGYGGSISLQDFGTELGTDAVGGTLALGGVYLNASADGGYTYDAAAGHGGNAFGGTIDLKLNRRNQTFSSLNANADAHDGDTSIDPMGGTVNLTVGGGITVDVASDMYLTANAVAGVNGGPGAIGQGGTVNLTVDGGGTLAVSGSFYGQARADVAVPYGVTVDSSPDLVGGAVNVLADGGTFHARDFYIDVGASNVGAATLAGSATGGTVSLGADNGGSLYTASIGGVGGFFNVLANGEGSSGARGNLARGGTVNLSANNGGMVTAFGSSITLGAAAGDDSFAPDTSGVGVNAFGGTINIDALGGTIQSGIAANVTAAGGSADGDAGDGAAGEVHVRSLGGTLSGLLNVSAEGYGGQSLVSGKGGDGRGGSLTLLSDAAATYAGFELSFLSESAGGSAAAGTGGDGYGGHAQVDVLGGTHTWTSVFMRGDSYGAASLGAGSLGGSAFGDPAGLNFHVGGGALTLTNGMTINATAVAGDGAGPLTRAIGGSAALTVGGGGTLTAPSIYAYAGGNGSFGDVLGGKGTGGTIAFTANNGGTISTPFLGGYADAQGGGSYATGGDAVGGSVSLRSTQGALDLDSIDFEATAYAGYGDNTGGAATGGKASIILDGGLYDWSNVGVSVRALAGIGGVQGNVATGLADAIDLTLLNGAALGAAGGLDLDADAYGTFNAGAGSAVRAGGINMSIAGDSSLAFGFLNASAQAGIVPSLFSEAPSTTPDTFGGTISLTVDGSALTGQSAGLFADASQYGALNNAGAAHGGSVALNLLNGSSLTLTSGEGGSDLNLSANGYGAVGDSAADAFGGSATLTVSDSTVNVATTIDVAALGLANNYAIFVPSGANITGFDATGGTATVTLLSSSPGSASLTAGNLTVDARGDASTPEFFAYLGETFGYFGGPFAGNGGTGTGGTATLNLGGGIVNLPTATVTADGSGGISAAIGTAAPFRSGDGRGGTAAVTVSGGTNTIGSFMVSAIGYGGDGTSAGGSGSPALAGDGFGGDASLTSSGGTLQSDTLAIKATGLGGKGGDGPDDSSLTPGGDGGNGTGGTARLVSTAGGTGTLILPAFNIAATGIGGTGGDAALGPDGNGGKGIGGTAAAQLADGAFSLGPLLLDADGTGGNGATGGEGSGGSAQFALIDSAGPSGARAMGSLSLHASGVGGTGTTGTVAASDAGSTRLDVSVGSSAAALVVTGDFEALARGSRAAAGSGFTATNSGALFQVTGSANIDTPRDVTITASSPVFVIGGFTSLSRSFTETGLLSAPGFIAITAPQGIFADQLRTDNGTTTLLATNGPVNVANLVSFGDVSALGRSIHVSDGGRLNVASAQATAGDLFIHAAGNLTLQSASATGAMDFAGNMVTANSALAPGGAFSASGTNGVSLTSLASGGAATLTSTNGTVSASGNVTSAGAFTASGKTGVSFGNLASGGTTSLTSSNGNVSVSNLTSAGLVTAVGRAVTLQGPGALAFANAQATAGDLNVTSPGNLTFGQASASGAISLTSTAGSLLATGPITAGGPANLIGATGLTLTALTSGGAASLSASNGAILVSDLTSAGLVTASGRSIDLGSSGALSFADAKATAGNLRVIASGSLVFAKASATGSIAMTNSAGSLTANGPMSAGGAVNLFGATGLALTSLTSGGTTLINGGSGALTVTSLTSTGTVTALGGSLDISSSGALTFSSIAGNSGAARISTSGNLAIGDGTVTGALTLTSANGTISSTGTMTAGGAVSLNGKTGLDFNRLNSGGVTSLVSASGPIRITRLASAGLVTASGASIDIGSGEGLRFDTVASPGAVSIVTPGDLLVNSVDAGGDLVLNSTGGSLTATGAKAGAVTQLTAGNGNILVGDLDTSGVVSATGLKVDISSTGSLAFDQARATSDNLTIRTGGDLAAATLFASKDMALTAGAIFRLTGEARAVNIAVTSGDIEIGGTAALGVRGTTRQIDLFNGRPSQETFIGGAHQTGAYSLDSGEVTRLFADTGIKLGVSGTGLAADQGHVTVGDLALSFGGAPANIGAGGSLEISTPTKLSIVGNVALTTVSAGDRFIIDPARVELNTDTGSIAMLGAGSTPLGQLSVTGNTIAVGTAATLTQLASQTDFASINALLDQPGGKADPLRAGTMTFNIVDGLFIQNTGASTAAADRRGFTANGLDITTASASTKISINGVILQGGTPVTGLATAPLVRINGLAPAVGGQFDPKSTINGCALGFDCSPPPPDTRPDYFPPPNDELEPPVTPGNPGEGTLSNTLIQLQDNEPLISPPLVDEPITGVGNDDLWVPECADPNDQSCPQRNEAR